MKPIIFAFPGNEKLAAYLAGKLDAPIGEIEFRNFPDGETYIRIIDKVRGKKVIIVCTLNQPNEKLLPLYYLSNVAKDLGAKSTCLIAPYLAYMRQDKIFREGEGITSRYFAHLLSQFTDSLITIDPHLHRIQNLAEIYNIPTTVVHAAHHISEWIKNNISKPLLVGPDTESKQWVADVAREVDAPYIVLQKSRLGDRKVEISIPQLDAYRNYTPVLIDDIISTARTMIETVKCLIKEGMKPPICIGVHGVFADTAYEDLLSCGVAKVVTCNTIPHKSNDIDVSDLFVEFVAE